MVADRLNRQRGGNYSTHVALRAFVAQPQPDQQPPPLGVAVVVELGAAVADDDFARLMLERTGNYVGTAIASVINLLNIATVVIGGPTMLAGNVMLNAIIRSARELSFSPSFESTLILAGELGELSAASGAALLSVNR